MPKSNRIVKTPVFVKVEDADIWQLQVAAKHYGFDEGPTWVANFIDDDNPTPATVAKIRKELLQLTPELDVTNYVNWLA